MRAYPRIYNQPSFVKNFSIVEIIAMVDTGTIAAKSIAERRRMRLILKNNIEDQTAWSRNAVGYPKTVHLDMAKKLKKYRRLVPEG